MLKKKKNAGEIFVALLLLNIPVILLAGFVHNHEKARDRLIEKYGGFPPQVFDKNNQESIERRKAWFSEHGLDPDDWNRNIYQVSKEDNQ